MCSGADVEENVGQTNVVDTHRDFRWADEAIEPHESKLRSRKGNAPPKAA
jgi:hypothetical protein